MTLTTHPSTIKLVQSARAVWTKIEPDWIRVRRAPGLGEAEAKKVTRWAATEENWGTNWWLNGKRTCRRDTGAA